MENAGHKKEIGRISQEMRKYLLDDILKSWARRTEDKEYGGYLTDFSRDWILRSTDKGAWAQGRQVFTFSYVYEQVEQDEKWHSLAKCGLEFCLTKMYAGDGRFNYLTDSHGNMKEGPISVFSDMFIILGLAKYINVFHENGYKKKLLELYSTLEKNVFDPDFNDIAPQKYEKGVYVHAVYMAFLNLAFEVEKILGKETTSKAIDRALKVIFTINYDSASNLIYERRTASGFEETDPNARMVTVGHVYESLWFALEVAISRNDNALIEKIKRIAEANNRIGRDSSGLSIYTADPFNDGVKFDTWKYEIAFKSHDRVSWAYAEEMVLWAKLFALTREEKYWNRFSRLYAFCNDHFPDRQYGDWFHALDENCNVKYDFKGSTIKDAFHIPRAYIKILKALGSI